MKELYEFRVLNKYSHLLFNDNEGENIGSLVKKVILDTSSPKFKQIGEINNKLWLENHAFLFTYWECKRTYTNDEILSSEIIHLDIRKRLDTDGDDADNAYDETFACPICGAHAKQVSELRFSKRNWLGKHDVSMTLSGEVIVSKKFRDFIENNHLKGLNFMPIYVGKNISEDCFQLSFLKELTVSEKTKFGVNPFGHYHDIINGKYLCFNTDPYKCPKGDNLGKCILSEVYIKENSIPTDADFIVSKQTYGGRMNLFRPYHMFFCTQRAMQLMKENGIKGFDYEVTHIVN